jgi:hypothetical protein
VAGAQKAGGLWLDRANAGDGERHAARALQPEAHRRLVQQQIAQRRLRHQHRRVEIIVTAAQLARQQPRQIRAIDGGIGRADAANDLHHIQRMRAIFRERIDRRVYARPPGNANARV